MRIYEQYIKDKEFIIHLRSIAEKYDSDFLRSTANSMDKLIEENFDNERQPTTRMETLG